MTTEIRVLRFGSERIEALQRDGQTYLRLGQLVRPFGVKSEDALRKAISRNPHLFEEGDVTKLPVETAGGVQEVSVIAWDAAPRLAGALRTPKAKKFSAWLTDVFRGYRRAAGRADGSTLRSMSNPFEIEAHPMFRLGEECWRRAAAIETEARARAKAERQRAERLWSNLNVTRKQAKLLIEAREVFAQPAQPSLPLLEG
jgi:prophage antirepressor-like protein